MDARPDRETEPLRALLTEDYLRAAMEQSDRDVEAGLTVSLEEVLADVDQSIARIEARRRAGRM